MKISEMCRKKGLLFSFEVFPPKRDRPIESIYAALEKLSALSPDYISVTYGAGGSAAQQKVTSEVAQYLRTHCKVTPLAHLTCINSSREEVDAMLDALQEKGVDNVLALRGDRVPEIHSPGAFLHANDLIRHIAKRGGFDIAAACYPEGHPEGESVEKDVLYLKEKVQSGASHLISQLFFDNEDFYRLLDLSQKAGIHIPIQAGVMPVVNAKQIERMVTLCGAKIPPKFAKIIARYSDNPEALYDAGVCYATEQIVDLIASGVSGIHLYTMNNPAIAQAIHASIKNLLATANTVPLCESR
jgi:methylenetetrahydrofolate reductase (NADPH)